MNTNHLVVLLSFLLIAIGLNGYCQTKESPPLVKGLHYTGIKFGFNAELIYNTGGKLEIVVDTSFYRTDLPDYTEKVAKRKDSYEDDEILFYSGTYTVFKKQLGKTMVAGEKCYTYEVEVNYLNALVDTFILLNRFSPRPLVNLNGDTLSLWLSNGMESNPSDLIFKRYYEDKVLGEWRKSKWVDSFPLLNGPVSLYFSQGDLLLIGLQGDHSKEDDSEMPGQHGKAGMVFLCFDSHTGSFLAYPPIKYVFKGTKR